MNLIQNQIEEQIILEDNVETPSKGNFIGANTQSVTLNHLKDDCIIPVFSKDNESTISHYQFIQQTRDEIQDLFPDLQVNQPEIRVSHIIKGRIPSAIGKPAKELLEHEKTIYYERCAFIIELPQIVSRINGNDLALSIGGVRAYNQENLYSKKSPEKFKLFIGFKNLICTNLCIATDGLSDQVRVNSAGQLADEVTKLVKGFNLEDQVMVMEQMGRHKLSESQFAHLIGKLRMYQFLNNHERRTIFPVKLNDGQINTVVKNYYRDRAFNCESDGSIDFWKIYNLITEANKSSYIDSNLERNVNAYELVHNLVKSLKFKTDNWFLHN